MAGGSVFTGGSAQVELDGRSAREWRRSAQLATACARQLTARDALDRQVAAQLLMLTDGGWVLLVDRRRPDQSTHAGQLLVGPGGVFIISVGDEVDTAQATRRLWDHVDDAVAAQQVSPVVVTPLRVCATADAAGGDFWWRVRANELLPELLALPHRLPPETIDALADRLLRALPAYHRQELAAAGTGAIPASDVNASGVNASDMDLSDVDDGAIVLPDPEDLVAAQARGRSAGIEGWMTFLHPDQISFIRRQFGGPARISGAPGTGKTVVGLHRAAQLARRGTGTLLFVSFVATLAKVQATYFARLAPTLVDRVEFTGLHAWAIALLRGRGYTPVIEGADECFDDAWEVAGKGGVLEQVEPDRGYWRDEVGYVIKGRGVVDLAGYLDLPRPGRRVPLQKAQRLAVWELYQEYEKLKKERDICDLADVLLDALAEVQRRPVTPAYSGVIVDEVQDLSLVAIRLLHALVGDAPNGLLLIGDGQQSVYPVGFGLAEARITIRGARSETLRRNYRNGPAILNTALKLAAEDSYDDIDGTTVHGRPDVEPTVHEGRIINVVTRTDAELDRALVGIVGDLAEVNKNGLVGVAVLCANARDVARYLQLFAAVGISSQDLDGYDGRPTPAIKVGTIRRGKGLEFDTVLLPRFNEAIDEARSGGFSGADRLALANRQLYVGMTRARGLLWLGQVQRRR